MLKLSLTFTFTYNNWEIGDIIIRPTNWRPGSRCINPTFSVHSRRKLKEKQTERPGNFSYCINRMFPVRSKKKVEGETDWEARERLRLRCIWLEGQKGLTEAEAAVLIVEEAKRLLQEDLGQLGIDWIPQGLCESMWVLYLSLKRLWKSNGTASIIIVPVAASYLLPEECHYDVMHHVVSIALQYYLHGV